MHGAGKDIMGSRAVVIAALGFLIASSFVEAQCAQGACGSFSINNCLGTISNTGFTGSGFSTATGTNQLAISCRNATGIKDQLYQFSVASTGLYTVKTTNIGSSDTTLQVMQCSNSQVLGCNDDETPSSILSSLVAVPLTTGIQYTAAVSKFSSGTPDATSYGLQITPQCFCSAFAPDACLPTVPATTGGLFSTGFTTSKKLDRGSLTCGSKESGLGDFVFQFQVAADGFYAISTENLNTNGDTTLSLSTCSGTSIGCNDDKQLNVIFSSEIRANLQAGVTYVGLVSKYDSSTRETNFDISIRLETSTPTQTPSGSPSKESTPRPSRIPSKAPTSIPSESPSKTVAPVTQLPVNQTSSPSSPDDGGGVPIGGANSSNSSQGSGLVIALGGGVGGGVTLLALGLLVARRRSSKRRATINRDTWSPDEESMLNNLYQTTHDFDYICGVFPQKSRESVAFRIKGIIDANGRGSTQTVGYRGNNSMSTVATGAGLSGEEGYSFVKGASLKPKKEEVMIVETPQPDFEARAIHASKIIKESVNKFSQRVASTSTHIMAKFKYVPPPPGLSAANPLFIPSSPGAPRPTQVVGNQLLTVGTHESIDPSAIPPPPAAPRMPDV